MARTRCSSSIPVFCPGTHTNTSPKLQALTFHPLFRSSSASVSTSMIRRGGAMSSFACSTSQFKRRVGSHRRHSKSSSLLSFGANGSVVAEAGETNWSWALLVLHPFVVAATAVVALAQPSTFTWSVNPQICALLVMASKRINKELKDLQKDPPVSCSAGMFACCLEEAAEEFLLKLVKLSDVKRVTNFVTRGEEKKGGKRNKKRRRSDDCTPSLSTELSPLSSKKSRL